MKKMTASVFLLSLSLILPLQAPAQDKQVYTPKDRAVGNIAFFGLAGIGTGIAYFVKAEHIGDRINRAPAGKSIRSLNRRRIDFTSIGVVATSLGIIYLAGGN